MSSLKYGLTKNNIELTDKKLANQKNFLENFIIDIYDTPFNLLASSMGANINPKKYFAEVNNRVNSLVEYARILGLYPVFLTITVPPELHLNSTSNKNLTVKDSVRYLSARWASFLRLKVFTNIKKEIDHNMIFIRVLEPHKDGTPHSHVLMFLPKKFILPVKKIFKRHFVVDGASTYAQNYKYTWKNDAGGAVAYIMKYINKTFMSAVEGKMSMEAYWCAFHSVRRFTTSQTLVPLNIYRKIKYDDRFKDMLWTTAKYKDNTIYSIFNKNIWLYRYCTEDEPEGEEVVYSRSPDLDKLFPKKNYQDFPKLIKRHKSLALAPVFINEKLSNYVFENDRFRMVKKPFQDYSDWDLLEYFNNLDVDQCDINHFVQIRNMCVGRGLIESNPFLTAQIFGFDDYKELITFDISKE